MRKRIVIGVLAIIGVVVSVYVISQPRKGSLGWHKNEYRKARIEIERMMESISVRTAPGFSDRLRQLYARVTGYSIRTTTAEEQRAVYNELILKERRHEEALLAAGFLAKHEFGMDSSNAVAMWPPLLHSKDAIADYVNGRLRVTDDKMLFVVTIPSNAVPKWEELIRRYTVPR